MPGYSDEAKNLMLDHLASNASYLSLHTADPGSNGSDEVDDSGIYERVSVGWDSASGGELSASNQPQFDVPGGTTVTHFGVWSAQTGGTYYGGGSLPSDEVFGSNGKLVVTNATLDLNLAE